MCFRIVIIIIRMAMELFLHIDRILHMNMMSVETFGVCVCVLHVERDGNYMIQGKEDNCLFTRFACLLV